MTTDWKKVRNETNQRIHKWPEGWDTREYIAEKLECSEDRVREILAPGIKSGDVEMKTFTIWDAETERLIRKIGFRAVKKSPKASSERVDLKGVKPSQLVDASVVSRSGNSGVVESVSKDVLSIKWQPSTRHKEGHVSKVALSNLTKNGIVVVKLA